MRESTEPVTAGETPDRALNLCGRGSNNEGRAGPTVAIRLSTAAIWAISPRSVRPPWSRACRSAASETRPRSPSGSDGRRPAARGGADAAKVGPRAASGICVRSQKALRNAGSRAATWRLLGCIRSRRRNALDVCVNLQKVDDLLPFFGLRERTETNVTHGACVAIQTDMGGPTGRTGPKLMLTPCLPAQSTLACCLVKFLI